MENPLRNAATRNDLVLIETGFWDGTRLRHAPLHLARLQAGAKALGWRCPRVTFTGPPHPARLRLTLDAQGAVNQTHAPVPAPLRLWRVGLCDTRLAADNPWLRVKSSNRRVYDQARAALPDHLDELIFQNERGEICDGTITTVFFDRGAGLRTPPLSCGLLPGVLRTALGCPEEVLPARDLPHVRLWLGNALRGLAPARFIARSAPGSRGTSTRPAR